MAPKDIFSKALWYGDIEIEETTTPFDPYAIEIVSSPPPPEVRTPIQIRFDNIGLQLGAMKRPHPSFEERLAQIQALLTTSNR